MFLIQATLVTLRFLWLLGFQNLNKVPQTMVLWPLSTYLSILFLCFLNGWPHTGAILDGVFGSQWNSQCIYNDPDHEVLTNGVCKTCYDNGICSSS